MIAQAQHEPLALDMLASEASHMRPEPASADERTIEVAEVLADPATETLAGSTDAEGGSTPSDDEQLQVGHLQHCSPAWFKRAGCWAMQVPLWLTLECCKAELTRLVCVQAFAPGSVVLILGNARTRASLHGQRATVSRATGLGGQLHCRTHATILPQSLIRCTCAGWHWLTLEETQERVKVQRNGLRLQSLPPAGPPPPAPREKAKPKAKPQPARPKLASRGASSRCVQALLLACCTGCSSCPGRADSGERIAKRKTARVDLSKLNGSALRKYSEVRVGAAAIQQQLPPALTCGLCVQVYQLPWGSGVSRDELAAQVMEHFRCELTVGNEDDVIHDFASAVSRTTDHSQRGFQAYGARSLCA